MMSESELKLIVDIEAFLKESGMSKSAFGVAVCGDGRLVDSMRRGRSVTLRTYDRITAFMAATRRFAAAA